MHSAPHVGGPRRNPDADPARDRDHRASDRNVVRTSSALAPAEIVTRTPPGSSITIADPGPPAPASPSVGAPTINAGTKDGRGSGSGARAALRHANRCDGAIPCRRATAHTEASPKKLSATIRALASADHRRRRPVSTTSSRRTTPLTISTSIRTVRKPQAPPSQGGTHRRLTKHRYLHQCYVAAPANPLKVAPAGGIQCGAGTAL